MKRYRICNFFIDTTRNIFKHPVDGNLESLKAEMKAGLISVYGEQNFDEKFASALLNNICSGAVV
jgi:hypothetical protein